MKTKHKMLLLFVILLVIKVKSKEILSDDLEEITSPESDSLKLQNEEIAGSTTENEFDEDNEDWMKEAVLDVAYYIRSHKFNNYDRRFMKESNKVLNLFKKFPHPPLKALHWEVNKYCSKGFVNCLKYLWDTIRESDLQRSQDTKVIIKRNKWTISENDSVINAINAECQRLLEQDYKEPRPFQGALERFQWITTASYYMCWFTMQEHPSLSLFEERCDNTANCLQSTRSEEVIPDLRSNNDFPYQCALYSFCPDPCCPLKKICDVNECMNSKENPCQQDQLKNWTCSLDRRKNKDFNSIVLNKWNYSCECNERTVSEWNSRFGMCLDIDECTKEEKNNCIYETQICVNRRRSYYCVCKPEFVRNSTINTCTPNLSLSKAIRRMNSGTEEFKSLFQHKNWFSIIRGIKRFFNFTEKDEEIYFDIYS